MPHATTGKPPWLVDLLDRASLPPVALALLCASLLLTVYLSCEYLWGELSAVLAGERDSLGVRATGTLLVLAALTPVGHWQHRRWTRQNVETLSNRFELQPKVPIPAGAGWGAGLAGAAVLLCLFFLVPALARLQLPEVNVQFVFALAAGLFYGWMLGGLVAAMVTDSLRLSALAEQIQSLDLFSLGSLSPFVRQGLGSVLLLAITLALSAHLFVAPGDAAAGSAAMLIILLLTMTLAFILPALGVHRLIRNEKARRLQRVRQGLRAAAARVESGKECVHAAAAVQALLALERRLEGVREWPIDAGNWARFLLYLLLGLGSWIGAAAVERLLEDYLR